MANAEPSVIFTFGELTTDRNGKLMIVHFRPYVPALTDFRDVSFHVHLKPFQGHSGMNLREVTAGSGLVGSGAGQMAHGYPVPSSGDVYRFFAKLKREARLYILGQLRAQKDAGKLDCRYPINANTDEKKDNHLWTYPPHWTGRTAFTTTTPALSTAAQTAQNQNGAAAGSIAAGLAAAEIAEHTGAPVAEGTVDSGDGDQDQANAA
jgi:hypothetical protein